MIAKGPAEVKGMGEGLKPWEVSGESNKVSSLEPSVSGGHEWVIISMPWRQRRHVCFIRDKEFAQSHYCTVE